MQAYNMHLLPYKSKAHKIVIDSAEVFDVETVSTLRELNIGVLAMTPLS